jgi:hypothetical protein
MPTTNELWSKIMSESIVIQVENRSELEALAHSKGYDTVQDYVLALIAVDSEAKDVSPVERFRAGWREAVAGHEGIPYDQMWEGFGE